jgi:gliding motility-associated-like protein
MKHTLLACRALFALFLGKKTHATSRFFAPRPLPLASCFLPLALCLLPLALSATHNRAGEIHIRQIGPLTVEATIITWTKASSIPADRDTLNICWGDGTPCQAVKRNNGGGNGVVLPGNIKYNTYVIIHTYAVPARYRISMTDPNRIAGIVNVNAPASENVPFHIETIYQFQNAQFGGNNTTPYLLQPPVDNACVGRVFKHNPNASDPDDDSLSYHLIVPLQSPGKEVPNYKYPYEIGPGPNNQLTLNERNGDLVWNSPQVAGEYNLAIIIVSWRNGRAIDTTIRDMQILVEKCDNRPPKVEAPDEICIVAGQKVEFTVRATDPDSSDLVLLTALGSPLISKYSPAKFSVSSGFKKPPVVGTFTWETTCEHISGQPYSVVFKAVDSLAGNPKLADLKAVSIKVVGPAPEGVQAKAQFGEVDISWDKPYVCENAAEKYFYGFSVWRREGSNPFVPDTCTPGLAGKGYTEIIFVTKEEKDGRYYFKDTKVERGRTYCYRILAKFAKRSINDYAYNIVESLPSEEVCVQLPRDLPLITNVSVQTTDAAAGQIEVRWSKPVAKDLDTSINKGPYRYQVLRVSGLSGGALQDVPGASFSAAQFWQANDTVFSDKNLDTRGQPYRYQVAFYVGGNTVPLGKTNTASSVFLNIKSTDKTNRLSWQEAVPWANYRYDVYRRNDATGQFDSIGSTDKPQYDDRGLINGKNYCYYVRSVGTYSIGGVADPLFNNSQENCGIPLDTIPPCVPALTVKNLCDGGGDPNPPYENTLTWTNPNKTCPDTEDAVAYNIWFAAAEGEPLALLERIDGAENTAFIHRLDEGLAGCYAVSAIDSVGNESAQSAPVCKDNCPLYELPNVFTPNGDNRNDLYTPFPNWRFIERVDMQVFNRWGNLVFQTDRPELNWTGTDSSGKELAEGAYLYVCRVYEKRVGGTVLRKDALSGYIELIRGDR